MNLLKWPRSRPYTIRSMHTLMVSSINQTFPVKWSHSVVLVGTSLFSVLFPFHLMQHFSCVIVYSSAITAKSCCLAIVKSRSAYNSGHYLYKHSAGIVLVKKPMQRFRLNILVSQGRVLEREWCFIVQCYLQQWWRRCNAVWFKPQISKT